MSQSYPNSTDLDTLAEWSGWSPHSGTVDDDFNKPFILYPSRKKAHRYNNQWFCGLGICLLLVIAMPPLPRAQDVTSWIGYAGILLYSIYVYLVERRKISFTLKPVIKMRDEGLEIYTRGFQLLIPWEQVKEVRAYKFWIWNVGIVPHNLKEVLANANQTTRDFTWLTALSLPFYRLLGLNPTAIYLEETDLPLSASEVVELINARKLYYIASSKPVA
jgi:hypothetical protein